MAKRATTASPKGPRLASALVILVVLIVANVMVSAGNAEIGHDLRQACPPGHAVEFAYGSTSFFIDLRYLDGVTLTLIAEKYGTECPIKPIVGFFLQFGQRSPELQAATASAPLPFWLFIRAAAPGLGDDSTLDPSKFGERWSSADGSYIQDVTAGMPFANKASPSRRVYRSHYVGETDWSDSIARIHCSGRTEVEPGRFCEADYNLNGDVFVRYRLFQNEHPWNLETGDLTASSTSEPEALLSIDANVRSWLDRLSRPAQP